MKPNKKPEFIQFTSNSVWYTLRGRAMVGIGITIAILCLVSPNVYMLGENASWLPVIGLVVLSVGVLRCIDGLNSKTTQGYLYNIQGGILDIVVGFLVFFSSNSSEIENENLLIVGYLLTQGIYRNVLLSASEIPNPLANRVTGLVSIILAFVVWYDWPTSMWFIAFSLSIDIIFRGWALMVMAASLKKHFND
ncbi:hypothetical protein Q9L42_012685 [Methylomarinum sp. Ch1-1]|uniref:Acid-resistance membrane protein n=1 Tax=Methylomarinum roseum TaxID=3067653 RepID=A0AAU7NQH2_9GAMM|nr:hypothetical protein [Methylomarinum sp. Ch1-1]MDP4520834.1 hypothetical protein [Methylomarinum sp. Ch1-1]